MKTFNGIPVYEIQRGTGYTLINSDAFAAMKCLDAISLHQETATMSVSVLATPGHYGGVTDDVRREFGETSCAFTFDLRNVTEWQIETLKKVAGK